MASENSYAIQGCQGCTVVKVAPRSGGQEGEKNRNGGQVGVNYWPKNQDSYQRDSRHRESYQSPHQTPNQTPLKSNIREWSDDINGFLNKSMSAINVDSRGDHCQKSGILLQNGVVNGTRGYNRTVNFDPGVWHSPQLANHRHRMKDAGDKLKSATLSPPTSRHKHRQQNGGVGNVDRNRNECKPLMGYKHVIIESPVKSQSPKAQQQSQCRGYEAAKRILNEKTESTQNTANHSTSNNANCSVPNTPNYSTLGPVHSPMISRRVEKGKKNKSPLAYSQRISGYRLANGYVNVTISPPKIDTIQLHVKDSTTMSPNEKRRTMCTAPTCNISTGYDRSTVAKPAVPPRTSSLSNASQPCHRSTGNIIDNRDNCSTSSGDSGLSTVLENSTQNSTHKCSSTGCPLLAAQRWIQQQRPPIKSQLSPMSLPSPSGLSQSSLSFAHPSSPQGNMSELQVLGGADTSRDSGFVSIGEEFSNEQYVYTYKVKHILFTFNPYPNCPVP